MRMWLSRSRTAVDEAGRKHVRSIGRGGRVVGYKDLEDKVITLPAGNRKRGLKCH